VVLADEWSCWMARSIRLSMAWIRSCSWEMTVSWDVSRERDRLLSWDRTSCWDCSREV